MKHCNKFRWLIGILSLAAVVAATVAAVVVYLEKKKKDEEDLEHYLDCSIQKSIKTMRVGIMPTRICFLSFIRWFCA